jgi:hypothetical protein
MNEEIVASELDFLLRFPLQPHVVSPVDFLSNSSWGGIRSLSAKDEFRYSKTQCTVCFVGLCSMVYHTVYIAG